jgi:hypothetical protein
VLHVSLMFITLQPNSFDPVVDVWSSSPHAGSSKLMQGPSTWLHALRIPQAQSGWPPYRADVSYSDSVCAVSEVTLGQAWLGTRNVLARSNNPQPTAHSPPNLGALADPHLNALQLLIKNRCRRP